MAISKKKREKVLKLIRNFEEKGEEDTQQKIIWFIMGLIKKKRYEF